MQIFVILTALFVILTALFHSIYFVVYDYIRYFILRLYTLGYKIPQKYKLHFYTKDQQGSYHKNSRRSVLRYL